MLCENKALLARFLWREIMYCELSDVQLLLPRNVLIGANMMEEDVNVSTSDVTTWIVKSGELIDAELSTIYRTPLIKFKEANFSVQPITFTEKYPNPVPLICARLTAGFIYDEIVMSEQSPNVSEWGKNMRALAYDDISQIKSGLITLRGQPLEGFRFVRKSLYDDPRVSRPGEYPPNQRQAGT